MHKTITVIVMTYNHVNYIRQALDSILSQKIDVDYDILIHDDCSNDGTYEILLDYKNKYENRIRIIHQESRKFLIDGYNMMIYKYVVPELDCDYVAYCDGDDYWIDDFKLKKQYGFMSTHHDYVMCFHSAYQLRPNNDISSKWFIKPERDLNISDFINDKPGVCVATSSIFLTKEIFVDFPNWRKQYPVEDVPMFINAALKGKIHGLLDIMCVYRQFATGSWSAQNKDNNNRIINHLNEMKKALLVFDDETFYQYSELVKIQINSYNFRIALLLKDFSTIFDSKNKKNLNNLPFKERISLVIQCRHPKLYHFLKKN